MTTWNEAQQRLEAAFRKLPISRPDDPEALSYESTIPVLCRELALMVQRPRASDHGGNVFEQSGDPALIELENFRAEAAAALATAKGHRQEASRAATEKELAELKKAAKRLLAAIDALHKPALDALNFRTEALIGTTGLTTRLHMLISNATFAQVPEQPSSRGAPEKDDPRRIARATAEHYSRLTGLRPIVVTEAATRKAGGPFLDLLTEVFAALGIQASAENQGREVGKEFRARADSLPKVKIRRKRGNKLL